MPAPTSAISGACSSTVTCAPCRAAASAAASPPMPPPMTVMSCPASMPALSEHKGRPARAPLFLCVAPMVSVVAMDLFAALVAFLRLEAHGGDRPRVEALERDGLARDLAIAVFAFLDPPQRAVDLGDQLALTVPRAQFQRAIGFLAGAVGDVGNIPRAVLQRLDSAAAFVEQIVFPTDELATEI